MNTNHKAVFLDRDGVLIHEVDYLSRFEQIRLFNDVPDGLKRLKNAGFLLVMVTNQSGVSRGYFTEEFVQETYDALNQQLSVFGVTLDALYYCPHHPAGNPPFNTICDCRKPAQGMIHKAVREHHLDCARSFMIGDKLSDIELAYNAGTQGILLTTGHGMDQSTRLTEAFPGTPVFDSFSDAVDHILARCTLPS